MINPKTILRGSVWLIDLDPVVGHEQAKRRPCVVVSMDDYNQGYAKLVAILPITSRHRNLIWCLPIPSLEGGLHKQSYVICDQVRSLSLERIASKCLGIVSEATLGKIEKRLAKFFAISPTSFSE